MRETEREEEARRGGGGQGARSWERERERKREERRRCSSSTNDDDVDGDEISFVRFCWRQESDKRRKGSISNGEHLMTTFCALYRKAEAKSVKEGEERRCHGFFENQLGVQLSRRCRTAVARSIKADSVHPCLFLLDELPRSPHANRGSGESTSARGDNWRIVADSWKGERRRRKKAKPLFPLLLLLSASKARLK